MTSLRSSWSKCLRPIVSSGFLTWVPSSTIRFNSTLSDSQSSHYTQYRKAQDLEVQDLIQAGLHQGHGRNRWNPVNLPYILGERQGLHVIDVTQTLAHLRRAAKFTELTASYGGLVLFVGSRPDLHGILTDAATYANAYYVTQWLPGTLTNAQEVLHQKNSKKKIIRPDVLVALDLTQTATQRAVQEAQKCNIPTIAPIDTNMDPRMVTYPIPANDEGLRGLELITQTLAQAAYEGYQQYAALQAKEQARQLAFERFKEKSEVDKELEGWTDLRHV